MTEVPAAALAQSSGDSKSPATSSTHPSAENLRRVFFRRSRRLDGRTKQRRLVKPYSSRISTTFAPMKPLEPVTRTRSAFDTINSLLIWGFAREFEPADESRKH